MKPYEIIHYPDLDYWKISPSENNELNIYKWHKNSHRIVLQEELPEKALAKARKLFSKQDTTNKHVYMITMKDDRIKLWDVHGRNINSSEPLGKVYYKEATVDHDYDGGSSYNPAYYKVTVSGDSLEDCKEKGKNLINKFIEFEARYG